MGELGGLCWRDIDLSAAQVSARHTLQRMEATANKCTKTVLHIGPPKSKASMRQFPLKEEFAHWMRQYYAARTATLRTPSAPVFTHQGKPVEPRMFQIYFKKVLRRAQLKDANFHALRHTFATRCIERNLDIQSLSECLGHSSSIITLSIYAHSFTEHKRECLNRLSVLSQAPLERRESESTS